MANLDELIVKSTKVLQKHHFIYNLCSKYQRYRNTFLLTRSIVTLSDEIKCEMKKRFLLFLEFFSNSIWNPYAAKYSQHTYRANIKASALHSVGVVSEKLL